MKLRDGQLARLNQAVIGKDKAGRPVGGHVLEFNRQEDTVLVSPPVHGGTWCKAGELVSLDALNDGPPAREAEQDPPGPDKSEGVKSPPTPNAT